MASPLRQQGAFDCQKPVIASQRARWRGNPFSLSMPEICTFYGDADCHTSDIGHSLRNDSASICVLLLW